MKTWRLLLVGCILAPGLLLIAPVFAQQPDPVCNEVRFFSETGHNVCDEFLEFFNSRGGAEIFGYPITERFIENGRLVQYFQRVRMEYHPELPLAYHVQLGLLGDLLAPQDQKARLPESSKPKSNDRARRYFPETGHTVEFSFLKFFEEEGGLDNFGYPVTEFILENGRVVQYFQRALMEWDPNQGGIVLHPLGEMWVDQHRQLQLLTEPAPQLSPSGESVPTVSTVNALRATASVRNAFAGRDGDQTVWVYVYDQNGGPVEGAEVTLAIPLLAVDRAFPMPPTDEMGQTKTTFSWQGLTQGQLVIIEARVHSRGLTTQARAFFFSWW